MCFNLLFVITMSYKLFIVTENRFMTQSPEIQIVYTSLYIPFSLFCVLTDIYSSFKGHNLYETFPFYEIFLIFFLCFAYLFASVSQFNLQFYEDKE